MTRSSLWLSVAMALFVTTYLVLFIFPHKKKKPHPLPFISLAPFSAFCPISQHILRSRGLILHFSLTRIKYKESFLCVFALCQLLCPISHTFWDPGVWPYILAWPESNIKSHLSVFLLCVFSSIKHQPLWWPYHIENGYLICPRLSVLGLLPALALS